MNACCFGGAGNDFCVSLHFCRFRKHRLEAQVWRGECPIAVVQTGRGAVQMFCTFSFWEIFFRLLKIRIELILHFVIEECLWRHVKVVLWFNLMQNYPSYAKTLHLSININEIKFQGCNHNKTHLPTNAPHWQKKLLKPYCEKLWNIRAVLSRTTLFLKISSFSGESLLKKIRQTELRQTSKLD